MKLFVTSFLIVSFAVLTGCQTGGGSGARPVAGNEGGTEPVNEQESYELQKAVNRCHRTGGTRVVKIKGELKCY